MPDKIEIQFAMCNMLPLEYIFYLIGPKKVPENDEVCST